MLEPEVTGSLGRSVGAGGRIVRNRGIGWTAQRLGRDVDALTADHLNELDGIIATRLQFRGINAKDFNSGNFTMPRNTTLDSIYDEQDALLASRQSVIENLLSEGRYRLGSDKESYLGVTYDAAFAGNGGRFLRELSSAGQTKASELAGGKNVVQDFEVKIPGAKRGFKWSDTSSRISRGNTSYVPTLTNIINHQWRNSPLAKRLLNGESDYVVIEWLRSADREAVYVRRELGISKSEAGQAVSDAAEVIRRYMPDPSLRAIAATRDVRMGEIEKSIKAFEKVDNEAYGTIVGKELILNDKLPSAWRRGLNRVYHYIGSLPEDVSSSNSSHWLLLIATSPLLVVVFATLNHRRGRVIGCYYRSLYSPQGRSVCERSMGLRVCTAHSRVLLFIHEAGGTWWGSLVPPALILK